jgi:hypothetical protein
MVRDTWSGNRRTLIVSSGSTPAGSENPYDAKVSLLCLQQRAWQTAEQKATYAGKNRGVWKICVLIKLLTKRKMGLRFFTVTPCFLWSG